MTKPNEFKPKPISFLPKPILFLAEQTNSKTNPIAADSRCCWRRRAGGWWCGGGGVGRGKRPMPVLRMTLPIFAHPPCTCHPHETLAPNAVQICCSVHAFATDRPKARPTLVYYELFRNTLKSCRGKRQMARMSRAFRGALSVDCVQSECGVAGMPKARPGCPSHQLRSTSPVDKRGICCLPQDVSH